MAIDNVESKNKEWIKEVISEIHRENAANFVGLERSIRVKLESLELRLNSTMEGLRKEISSHVSAFTSSRKQGNLHSSAPIFFRPRTVQNTNIVFAMIRNTGAPSLLQDRPSTSTLKRTRSNDGHHSSNKRKRTLGTGN